MSSTYTDKNNPFSLLTKKHSQLETFSQPCFKRISSNCLSHNSPAKGWSDKFLSRKTTGSSILDHDFGQLCRCRRIQMSGHSDFGIFKTSVHLPFYMGISRHKPWYNVHDFCGCHLGCWWSLFSQHCVWSLIIFYKVATEYNSAFVLLIS